MDKESKEGVLDNRRESILKAAYRLFGTVGYARTSMKDIASEAGVAQGLIGYYFGSKEGLLVSVVREWMLNRGIPEALGQLEKVKDANELLELSLRHIITFRRQNAEWFTLMLSLWLESRQNPDLANELKTIYAGMLSGVCQVLNRLDLNLNAEEIHTFSVIIQSMMDGLTIQASISDKDLSLLESKGWKGMQWLLKGAQID